MKKKRFREMKNRRYRRRPLPRTRFTLANEKIAAIEVIGDLYRLRQLQLAVLAP